MVRRYDEIDGLLSHSRCPCGARLTVRSEGSIHTLGRALRVVHTECDTCETTSDFFFDLTKVLN